MSAVLEEKAVSWGVPGGRLLLPVEIELASPSRGAGRGCEDKAENGELGGHIPSEVPITVPCDPVFL